MPLEAVNCRRDDREPDVWRPAGMPAKEADDCREFAAEFPLDAETTAVLTMKGMQLGVAISKATNDETELRLPEACAELGQVEARAIGCEVVEEGVLRIFLSHSRSVYASYRRDADAPGGWRFTMHGRMPALPPLLLRQGRRQTMSEPVSALKL